jgi:hypothetical protein
VVLGFFALSFQSVATGHPSMLHSAADFSDSFCGTQNKVGTPMRVEAGLDLCAVRLIIIIIFSHLEVLYFWKGQKYPTKSSTFVH